MARSAGSDIGSLVRAAEDGLLDPQASPRRYDRGGGTEGRIRRMMQQFGRAFERRGGSGEDGIDSGLAVAAELVAAAMAEQLASFGRRQSVTGADRRFLVTAGGRSSAVIILDPGMPRGTVRQVPFEEAVSPQILSQAAERMFADARELKTRSPESRILSQLGPASADLARAVAPDVIVTSRPRMEPLCVPNPMMTVDHAGELSTAGIMCRNPAGQLGVTACYHGTGPVGTQVVVDLRQTMVAAADLIQDIVFLPLDEAMNLPELTACSGIRSDEAPSAGMPVRFEGAKSGAVRTRVSSHDAGLLRRRPGIQLKVQTPADTNRGDSGSALVDGRDQVVGFAFHRSAYGEFPEITDWIWASNALAALGLTPLKV
ncbi:S1C family serine protease [Sphingomonas sp. LK11]|uniref:S1C family serine protease n=2 Tax=unclassified Sphingomonas TaxID=196159 RepID=UPI00155FE4FE|nr:S1C family serine protease [Sphingomonas sp. LK11]